MSKHYDVVIVGGGLVGACLALALAQRRWRVAVVERAAFRESAPPTYDDRTLALSRASQNILRSIGLWQRLEGPGHRADAITPISQVQVTQKGAPGLVTIAAGDYNLDALGHVVQARRLGQAVLAVLPETPGIDLLVPCEVADIDVGADRVTVQYQRADAIETLSASLLVGADGTHSKVRDAAGIAADSYSYQQTAIIANVTPQQAHKGRAFERMTRSGPLAMLPHVERRCGVVWCCDSDDAADILNLDDEAFLQHLQRRFGYRLGHLTRVGKRASYPLSKVIAESPVARRTVVVGNAAHTIHPVAAQGFNLGLRDVAALCEVLDLASADQGITTDPGGAELLDRYARWRDPDVTRTVAFTDGMVRAFGQGFGPVVLARSLGMLALQLVPELRAGVAQRGMGFGGRRPPRMALDEVSA